MGQNTKIEWAHHTFNPWIGCTKVAHECANCYAERDQDHRRHRVKWGKGQPRSRTSPANWKHPLQWNRECEKRGIRNRVFCASLADWLDDDGVGFAWLRDLLNLITLTPNLDWLLLSKRPENWEFRMRGVLAIIESCGRRAEDEPVRRLVQQWLKGNPPLNAWLGTTCGHPDSLHRIANLQKIPARIRFISAEPLLKPIDLASAAFNGADSFSAMASIHWVIAGGESGPNARPMHPDCPRTLRDQCAAANVPYFFKQWGEWAPWIPIHGNPNGHAIEHVMADGSAYYPGNYGSKLQSMIRVGKSAAGRLLDGIEHNAIPEPRA
jgi:protein gp37